MVRPKYKAPDGASSRARRTSSSPRCPSARSRVRWPSRNARDDDEFRRAALRLLRRLDLTGVGLIETSAALRWLTIAAPLFVLVDRKRVAEVLDAIAGMPVEVRPMIIATSRDISASQSQAYGVRAEVTKPLDPDEFLRTIKPIDMRDLLAAVSRASAQNPV